MKQVSDLQQLNLFSIGHGNRKFKDFLLLLNKYNINVLIDVRTFPYSRYNPQFRQRQLETELNENGIQYLFLGKELGGRPEDPSLYRNNVLDHSLVKQTHLFKEGIQTVTDLVEQNIKVTLMCSESNPNDCHRKHLIADELIKENLEVWHITKTGDLEKHITNSNPSLFD